MPVTQTKTCKLCGESKPLSEYARHPSTRDRLDTRCKECERARSREYQRRRNKAEKAAYMARFWAENPDKRTRGDLAKERQRCERRRARIKSTFVEDIDRSVLYERDGGVCHICEELIPRDAAYPDPRSFSVDHVVPISKGGEHSYANVKASHLRCNIQRKDRDLC